MEFIVHSMKAATFLSRFVYAQSVQELRRRSKTMFRPFSRVCLVIFCSVWYISWNQALFGIESHAVKLLSFCNTLLNNLCGIEHWQKWFFEKKRTVKPIVAFKILIMQIVLFLSRSPSFAIVSLFVKSSGRICEHKRIHTYIYAQHTRNPCEWYPFR